MVRGLPESSFPRGCENLLASSSQKVHPRPQVVSHFCTGAKSESLLRLLSFIQRKKVGSTYRSRNF